MESIFPATYSSLCPIALASLIADNYYVKNVHCKLITRGVGDTYLIETDADSFILRVYRSTHRSWLQIKEEIEILLLLKDAGVSVS